MQHGASAASVPATEFVVPAGPTISLQDGQVINGDIIALDQTNVVIRTRDGIERVLARATLDQIRFKTVTGTEIGGALLGWRPGVYELTTADRAISVYSTVAAPPTGAVAEATSPPALGQGRGIDGTNDAAPGDEAATPRLATAERQPATPAVEEDLQEEIPPPTTAPAAGAGGQSGEQQVAVATPTTDLEIDVSVGAARENGPPVVFDIQLSHPSKDSVVIIYATIDGTAVTGEDYEAQRGVMVIKAGETSARIEAPVIDDQVKEGEEYLQLFLTVDPNVAVVRNKQIIATIEDDDQG